MYRKSLIYIVVIFIIINTKFTNAEKPPKESPPPPLWGEVNESEVYFKYISDADQEYAGTWYYEWMVENHSRRKLKVDWKVKAPEVPLINNASLNPRGKEDDKAFNRISGIPEAPKDTVSILKYGRSNTEKKKEPKVYIPKDLRALKNPVLSDIKMVLEDKEGKKFKIDISAISHAKESSEKDYYEFTYNIINRSQDPVFFSWNIDHHREFFKQINNVDKKISINTGTSDDASFYLNVEPKLQYGYATFLHPKSGDILGSAFMPSIVPKQESK